MYNFTVTLVDKNTETEYSFEVEADPMTDAEGKVTELSCGDKMSTILFITEVVGGF